MLIQKIYWFVAKFYKSHNISFFANISISTKLEYSNLIEKHAIIKKSNLGSFSYVAFSSYLDNVHVGKFTSIGPGCMIGLAEHPVHRKSSHPVFYSNYKHWKNKINKKKHVFTSSNGKSKYNVYIGNDVWIGAGVYILNGIEIGDGSIIATGAVVTKNVEAYTICGGIPAKLIKKRPSKNKSKNDLWWEKDLAEIKLIWDDFA